MNQHIDTAEMTASAKTMSARDWVAILQRYRKPDFNRSILEVAITVVPLASLWCLAWAALSVSYLLTLAISIPAAFFLVRLFIIQHDCGHGAFFKKRATNDWFGRVLGIFTWTPYDVWARNHAVHHATSGDLDNRGTGDIETLTVEEYRALSPLRRLQYRAYRHPITLFVIGPAYIFVLKQRLPFGQMRDGWRPWVSTLATNAGLITFAAIMMFVMGPAEYWMVQLPILLLSASIGVWLFYIQHQFEDTFWAENPHWSHHEAALYGSSHYDLPVPLGWATGNIGIHHVHHLYARIPFYRLPQVLRDFPELGDVNRVTLWQSFKYGRLHLWDKAAQKLIPVRDVAV